MKTFKIKSLLFLVLITLPTIKAQENKLSAEEIIKSYVEDYKNDQHAQHPMTFGINIVDKGQWTVNVSGEKVENLWDVSITSGLPNNPTFIYVIEHETLQAIHNGELNALTAQGKAFVGDYTPMSVKEMEGFKTSEDIDSEINKFSFHFWTKGFPEVVPFGEGLTRRAHGSNFVVFYYQKGLRTAWYRVLPNEIVRDDPREQVMPFPIMIVAIKGTTEGEVGGKRVSLTEGNTLFVPPYTTHKWWNETKEATEAVLIMFGEGA
ncbi:cupin domain-containing protein [Winogradskyella sp. A2]|uniref:cupin domain-containing protein n=1 Tax=Winogradskyella sp. A2 TaxID=3366944 RepID=UPI00398C2601